MSESSSKPATQIGPEDPPPEQEEPTHDVPVYPEGDPPPEPETMIRLAAAGPGEHDLPDEGEDDVDEDRKSTRLNSSHLARSRMPSSA